MQPMARVGPRLTRAARSAAVGALAAATVAGCSSFEPTGDHRIAPPAEYRAWFAETQACSGLKGNFDRIEWYEVDGGSFDCPGGKCVGRWNANHRIFIASDYLESEMVVRHEMLHELIGHPGHPDPPFGNPCPLTWESWRAAHGDSASAFGVGRLVGMPLPRID
ncbi:MAG TPA: hypothetical protein VFW66_15105 [Gemmatimonadales bacterium]|nr:hypothetical protein [Gemmatimonadales bacterium]